MNASQLIEAINLYTERTIDELKKNIRDPRVLCSNLLLVETAERQCIEAITRFEKQLERSER